MHVAVRKQLVGVSSLLPQCMFQGPYVRLLAKPSCYPQLLSDSPLSIQVQCTVYAYICTYMHTHIPYTWIYEQLLNKYINRLLYFYLYYINVLTTCMYVCVPKVCLVLMEVRRRCQIPGTGVMKDHHVGAGNQTQVLYECNKRH